MSLNELPVILVSAADVGAASSMIVELISIPSFQPPHNGTNEPREPEVQREPWEVEPGCGLVWRIVNKYYVAFVRLQPCGDQPVPAAPPADVQAHLIYLSEDECGEESASARRAEAARAHLARGAVRLVAAAGAPSASLAAWARAARYELVPLLPEPEPEPEQPAEPEDPEDPEEPEPGAPAPAPVGVARLREALHAHVWPGLVRRAVLAPIDPAAGLSDSSSDSSSDGSWGSWRGARPAEFAAALALVPGARARGEAAGRLGGDAARRLNAEQLVDIFCHALDEDMPLPGEDGDQ